MKSIHVASQFSPLPGPRHIDEGPNSGQEFREKLLEPAFRQAIASGEELVIDLDGVEFGYPPSFLEEAFGGLVRLPGVGVDLVRKTLRFKAESEPLLLKEIDRYIVNANSLKPPIVKRP
jgi:hypothetical protein